MVKYFCFKGHESKLVHKELVSTLQDNAISLSTVKNSSGDSNPATFPAATKNGLEDL
jgi:hypothetical protein